MLCHYLQIEFGESNNEELLKKVIYKCVARIASGPLLLQLLQFQRMGAVKQEWGCQCSVICGKPSLANCEAPRCDHRDAEHLQLPRGKPVNYTTLSTLSNDMRSIIEQGQSGNTSRYGFIARDTSFIEISVEIFSSCQAVLWSAGKMCTCEHLLPLCWDLHCNTPIT